MGLRRQGELFALTSKREREPSHLGLRSHSRAFSVPTSYNLTQQPLSLENNLSSPKKKKTKTFTNTNILPYFLLETNRAKVRP